MDWHLKNIKAYDDGAAVYSNSLEKYGPRINDIDLGLKLAGASDNARIVEIGCGSGRDAQYIVEKCSWYQGFDPSTGLLNIAKKRMPDADFVIADALSYEYPKNIDVIFAFNSLLHINRDNLRVVFEKVAQSLRPAGVILFTIKERSQYAEESKIDERGLERMFYFYNSDIIKSLCGESLSMIFESRKNLNDTDWLTLALKKI